MIIRDPTLARSEETRELIGEYLAYDIGRTELDRVASQARAGVYTRDQYERIDPVTGERTGYTRAIDEVNRGTGIEGYRTTVEEVEAVGRAHRNDIPPEYDRMIESYRQGYGQQAVADAMRLRLEEGFGRLAEPSFGEAAINHAEGVNIRMYVFLQPPPVESDQAAPSPGTAEPTQSWRIPEENYNIVKTDLVNESRRYHRLGMDEVANGYAEALTCVNNASRATDMATQNEEIAKAQQIIERLTTTVAQGDEGLNGVIYNAVQTAEQQMRTERAEGDAKVHRAVEYGEQVYRRAETRFGPIEEWERVSPRPTDTAGGDSGTQPPPSEPPPGSQPETPPEEPGEGRRKRPRKEVEKTLDEIVQDEIEEHETEEARKRRGKR
jgi:hypothetical protein